MVVLACVLYTIDILLLLLEVLRRLVSKCLVTLSHRQALRLLSPLQLGVGVKGGCEAIVHATNHLMTSLQDNDCWTLLLDFSNAFNSISLDGVLLFQSAPPPPW